MIMIFVTLHFFSVCKGSVMLLHSSHPLNITADEIRSQNSSDKFITSMSRILSGLKNPDSGEILRFKILETRGDCCWEFRSRRRGGKLVQTWKPETLSTDWPIKNVTLGCTFIKESRDEGTKCEAEDDSCYYPIIDETGGKITTSTIATTSTNNTKVINIKLRTTTEINQQYYTTSKKIFDHNQTENKTIILVSIVSCALFVILSLSVSVMCWLKNN